MAIRLVVTITAAPGKGAELAQADKARCTQVMQGAWLRTVRSLPRASSNPDRFTLLERWADQAALETHAKVNQARPPLPAGLRAGAGEREDYEYKRTR